MGSLMALDAWIRHAAAAVASGGRGGSFGEAVRARVVCRLTIAWLLGVPPDWGEVGCAGMRNGLLSSGGAGSSSRGGTSAGGAR